MKIKQSELVALRKIIHEQFEHTQYERGVSKKISKVVTDHLELIVDEIMHIWMQHFEDSPDDPVLQRYGKDAWNRQVEQASDALQNKLDRDNIFDIIIDAISNTEEELHSGEYV